MSWEEICHHPDYVGRWVALSDCLYDQTTGEACAGSVIDVDDCLSALCQRVRVAELRDCAILRCEAKLSLVPPKA